MGYFKHEFLDRIYTTSNNFDDNIKNHPVSNYFSEEIEEIESKLFELYQKVGNKKIKDKDIKKSLKEK